MPKRAYRETHQAVIRAYRVRNQARANAQASARAARRRWVWVVGWSTGTPAGSFQTKLGLLRQRRQKLLRRLARVLRRRARQVRGVGRPSGPWTAAKWAEHFLRKHGTLLKALEWGVTAGVPDRILGRQVGISRRSVMRARRTFGWEQPPRTKVGAVGPRWIIPADYVEGFRQWGKVQRWLRGR